MALPSAEISAQNRGFLLVGTKVQREIWGALESRQRGKIRKVHRSLCFRAGLQSLGGKLIKNKALGYEQVTMGFWHPGTRQESSYQS